MDKERDRERGRDTDVLTDRAPPRASALGMPPPIGLSKRNERLWSVRGGDESVPSLVSAPLYPRVVFPLHYGPVCKVCAASAERQQQPEWEFSVRRTGDEGGWETGTLAGAPPARRRRKNEETADPLSLPRLTIGEKPAVF